MSYYEVKNNLEQSIPLQYENGKQVVLPQRGSSGITLSEEEVNFFQIKELYKSNLIRIKEVRGQR